MRGTRSRRLQRGQAMAEMAVALVALAPLMFAVPWLYRFQGVQRDAISAAREASYSAAFGGLPPGSEDRLAHLHRWHFDDPTTVAPTTGDALVPGTEALRATLTAGPPPGLARDLQSGLIEPLRVVGGFLGADFVLEGNGYQQVLLEVSLPALAAAPAPIDSLALVLQEQAGVLGDPWGGGSPEIVARRVRGLMPTGFLAEHQQLVQTALWPARLLEPALGQLCLGLVEPDRVPADRLDPQPGNRPQPGQAGCR